MSPETPDEVGAKVTHLKPGDRVALEPGAVCNLCHECKSGKYEVNRNNSPLAPPLTLNHQLCGHIRAYSPSRTTLVP